MISQKGGVFMFLRAQLSAQMATIADFLVTILLVRLFDVYYVYATLAGAIYGGIVNCVINYKWTFKSKGKKTHIAVKFIIVWICSIWLNTWGTYTLTESLMVDFLLTTRLFHFVVYRVIRTGFIKEMR